MNILWIKIKDILELAIAKFLALIAQKSARNNSLKPNQMLSFAIFEATNKEENKKGRAKIECLNTTSSKMSLIFIIINAFIFILCAY